MKRYAFDLDGTLCATDGMDYMNALPLVQRIDEVNRLYRDGAYIIIHTARGYRLDHDRRLALLAETRDQLLRWGLLFHEIAAKVAADVYVDDRALNADLYFTDREA